MCQCVSAAICQSAIFTYQPLKIFQADVFSVLPDLLFPFVSLGHANMLAYVVALYKYIDPIYIGFIDIIKYKYYLAPFPKPPCLCYHF
jgi:hypothetical protein